MTLAKLSSTKLLNFFTKKGNFVFVNNMKEGDLRTGLLYIMPYRPLKRKVSMIDLNEMKSYDCQFPDPFILVVSNTPKFIDSIRIDRFNLIVSSYLEISSITWKPRKKKFKLICLFHWWVANIKRKSRGSSIQSICSLGMKDLRFQPLTRGQVCFKWRGQM